LVLLHSLLDLAVVRCRLIAFSSHYFAVVAIVIQQAQQQQQVTMMQRVFAFLMLLATASAFAPQTGMSKKLFYSWKTLRDGVGKKKRRILR